MGLAGLGPRGGTDAEKLPPDVAFVVAGWAGCDVVEADIEASASPVLEGIGSTAYPSLETEGCMVFLSGKDGEVGCVWGDVGCELGLGS